MLATKHLSLFAAAMALSRAGATPNFLFITVDDLRPELHSYGATHMLTPNLDKLARSSAQFSHAYVQQPLCSPSRTSMLLGRYPDTTGVYDLYTYFRTDGCNVTTLPQYFAQNGYVVAGAGKVFHPGHASGEGVDPRGANDPPSWTVPFFVPPALNEYPWNATYNVSNMAWDAPEAAFPDGQIADYIISQLYASAANGSSEPFFLAAGFMKPHLPFVVPPSYLAMYANNSISVAQDSFAPADMPSIAWSEFLELRMYNDIAAMNLSTAIANDMPDWKAIELRRAYYAAVSFVDAQIGKVLDTLDALNLTATTTVVLLGDHGWQLGEHAEWGKETNFELSARAPLFIRAPAVANTSAGRRFDQLVEYVDLFPTMVDLAQLPEPAGLQGMSLLPILSNPSNAGKSFAFTQCVAFFTTALHNACGHALRPLSSSVQKSGPGGARADSSTSFPSWVQFNNNTRQPQWQNVLGEELYDHDGDDGTQPWMFENTNVVNATDNQKLVELLRQVVKDGPFGYQSC